ncbi:MAG: SPFH domain-containing protein, partial [Clostridia bacterium]|nr:SPFH domain-containing protein [Clostridia bacterium]
QWKEFFYCDALDKDVLVVKGQKRTSNRSSNTKGNDNIISNGSGIAVADGQCMIIVEQGKVVEVCAEPGEFTYDTSSEPSIFAGSLGESIKETFRVIGKRFTYGGDTAKDQRIYYFNTKEIMDNKFGTPNPIMFRIVDSRINLDMEADVRCNGVYSYRIIDPILFYTNVCANVADEFRRDRIDGQLKTEFVDALAAGFGALTALELRPSQINSHTRELKDAMNAELSKDWAEKRGITIVSIGMNPGSLSPEDAEALKRYQRAYTTGRDPSMAGGVLVDSMAGAMGDAASNAGGAMNGFVGMGMGMNMMGGQASSLFAMGQGQQPQQPAQGPNPQFAQPAAPAAPEAPAMPAADSWPCACGAVNTGKFCTNCGQPKPEPAGWTCACGAQNSGNFCTNCGSPKPAAPVVCPKCGFKPEPGTKFCPNCGEKLN